MAQHRVLIFCQLKSMLDIVEHDLLKPKLPTVTYLRLDGSVQAGLRHSIVSRSVDSSLETLLINKVCVTLPSMRTFPCATGLTMTHPLMCCC